VTAPVRRPARVPPLLAALALLGATALTGCGTTDPRAEAQPDPTEAVIAATTESTTTTLPPTTLPPTTTAPPLLFPVKLAPPAPLAPVDAPANPDEGGWEGFGPLFDGQPGAYWTQVRPNAATPAAGIVWIDPNLVSAQLFPGASVPGGSFATPPYVPKEQLPALLAAFNGGFLMKDARGGFFLEGQEAVPLRVGAASLVIDVNGVPTVGQWGRDVGPGPGVASVLQNLELLVDGGTYGPTFSPNDTGGHWGPTLSGAVRVWRSGVGVRPDGAPVWVGGPSMNVQALADAFIAAGAVRAMELDINPNWVTFNSYEHDPATGATTGFKLLSSMNRPANRYLSADDRNFVALFAR